MLHLRCGLASPFPIKCTYTSTEKSTLVSDSLRFRLMSLPPMFQHCSTWSSPRMDSIHEGLDKLWTLVTPGDDHKSFKDDLFNNQCFIVDHASGLVELQTQMMKC